jgi:hypothetical protein
MGPVLVQPVHHRHRVVFQLLAQGDELIVGEEIRALAEELPHLGDRDVGGHSRHRPRRRAHCPLAFGNAVRRAPRRVIVRTTSSASFCAWRIAAQAR